jgi:porphobilinogen deaminase
MQPFFLSTSLERPWQSRLGGSCVVAGCGAFSLAASLNFQVYVTYVQGERKEGKEGRQRRTDEMRKGQRGAERLRPSPAEL